MKSFLSTFLWLYFIELLLVVGASSNDVNSNFETLSLVKRGANSSKQHQRLPKSGSNAGSSDRVSHVPTRVSKPEWGNFDVTRLPPSDSESLSRGTKRKLNRNRAWSGSSYETSSGSTDTKEISRTFSAKGREDEATSSLRDKKGKNVVTGNPSRKTQAWDSGSTVDAHDGDGPRRIQIVKPIKHKGNSEAMQLHSGQYQRKLNPERKTKVWRLKNRRDAAQLFTGRSNNNQLIDPSDSSSTYHAHPLPHGVTPEAATRNANHVKIVADRYRRQEHVFRKKRRATETPEEKRARICKNPRRGAIDCER